MTVTLKQTQESRADMRRMCRSPPFSDTHHICQNKKMSIIDPIPLDKRLHFAAGFVVAAVLFVALLFANQVVLLLTDWQSLAIAFAASVVAGAAKELLDWRSNKRRAELGLPPNHDVDVYDFWYTVAGGFVCALLISIVIYCGWIP